MTDFHYEPKRCVFHNGYQYRQSITIPAWSVDADVANFPVYVQASNVNDYNASDFTFEDTTENVLPFEIDVDTALGWENLTADQWAYLTASEFANLVATGSADSIGAWVTLPEIKKDQDTHFYFYYGNPDILTIPEGNGWSQYTNVYHLDEEGESFADSADSNDGTGGSTITRADGLRRYAQQFIGNTSITIADNISASDPFTVSAWIKADMIPVERVPIVEKENFGLGVDISGKAWASVTTIEGIEHRIQGSTLNKNQWYYLAAVWNPGVGLSLFVDGVPIASTNIEAIELSPSSSASIGRRWRGAIDEVRIANNAKTPAWIKSEYTAHYIAEREESAVNLSGWATVRISIGIEGVGGFANSGQAVVSADYITEGTGGFNLSGGFSIQYPNHTGSGGIIFGDGAAVSILIPFVANTSPPIQLEGTAAVQPDYLFTAQGGITTSGHFPTAFILHYTGSGGMVQTGAAVVSARYRHTGSGNVSFVGQGSQTITCVHIASGLISFGGSPVVTADYIHVGSGGIVAGGSGIKAVDMLFETTGGFSFGGQTTFRPAYRVFGSGGMTHTGQSIFIPAVRYIGSGDVTFGGSAEMHSYFMVAGGSILFGGNTTFQSTYCYQGSGLLTFRIPPTHSFAGTIQAMPRFKGKITTGETFAGTIQAMPRFKGRITT